MVKEFEAQAKQLGYPPGAGEPRQAFKPVSGLISTALYTIS